VDRHRGVSHDFLGHTAEIGALLIQILLAAAVAGQNHHVGLGFLDGFQNLAGGVTLDQLHLDIGSGFQFLRTDPLQMLFGLF